MADLALLIPTSRKRLLNVFPSHLVEQLSMSGRNQKSSFQQVRTSPVDVVTNRLCLIAGPLGSGKAYTLYTRSVDYHEGV
jgi:type II secretory ATPase GspE/PulE/Tfp pilus assembly ATPase PilB-like protein